MLYSKWSYWKIFFPFSFRLLNALCQLNSETALLYSFVYNAILFVPKLGGNEFSNLTLPTYFDDGSFGVKMDEHLNSPPSSIVI